MTQLRHIINILILLTLFINILQCGGSGDSGLVKISALQAAILRALPQSGSPCAELAENAHAQLID